MAHMPDFLWLSMLNARVCADRPSFAAKNEVDDSPE